MRHATFENKSRLNHRLIELESQWERPDQELWAGRSFDRPVLVSPDWPPHDELALAVYRIVHDPYSYKRPRLRNAFLRCGYPYEEALFHTRELFRIHHLEKKRTPLCRSQKVAIVPQKCHWQAPPEGKVMNTIHDYIVAELSRRSDTKR